MRARLPWLLLYVFVNVIAAYIMLDSGQLVGDMAGNALYSESALYWATILVVLSYLVLLGPVFKFFSKIKIERIDFGGKDVELGNRFGKLLLLLQAGFMVFNLSTGVNIAGAANTRTDHLMGLLWILVPVDALFLVFYGFHRDNKYFAPNLLLWLVSNLSRGWAGVFLIVVFFEWCRAVRNRKMTVTRAAVGGVLLLALYPVLTNLKWLIRASTGAELSFGSIAEVLVDSFQSPEYFGLIADGIEHLIGRIQYTSIVVEVMRLSDVLQEEFAKGSFSPFWMEGLHGIIWERLSSSERPMPVAVALTQLASFGHEFDVGDWNVNIGYVGWFFIAPHLAAAYIAYTLLLAFFSFFLVKKIGTSDTARDMLWLVWLEYLMAPWLAALVGFVYALIVFIAIKLLLKRLPKFEFLPRTSPRRRAAKW